MGALAGAWLAPLAPAANAAFGPETFEAGTCVNDTCTYASVEANHEEAFTQAAGHPQWGITKFELKHSGNDVEGAALKRIRVDVPPGLAANPQALPKCSQAQFKANACPGESEVGTTELNAVAAETLLLTGLKGKVFNLEQPAGLPLDFGINIEPAGALAAPVKLYLEGHVDWSGDYHEFFEINDVPEDADVELIPGVPVKAKLKTLMSKLNFDGRAGNFLTLPSVCSSTTTSFLELESWKGEIARTETHTPVGVERCDRVPFAPTTEVKPETTQSDQPDGVTVEVKVPQQVGPEEINTADISDAEVTLPEGLTLNPSSAHGLLEACTPAEIGIGTSNPVSCPASSRLGSVAIETDLPPHSLTGNVYLGDPGGGAITGPPYTLYLDAESIYGVSVRLQGQVSPNPTTGRLETTFTENPQLPFSKLVLQFNGGSLAPLANPLVCESSLVEALFTPYTGLAAASSSSPFLTSGCPSPLPFALTQSAHSEPASAGAHASFTFTLARADGQQYPSALNTVLPAGLVGLIGSVEQCPEPQAASGTCPSASQIGTATVAAGAGTEPYTFAGPVFLTGPYGGGPFGLSIAVPALAGPFDLGTVLTRAAINVDPTSARVSVSSVLPRIVGGVPLRLKMISVAITRPNFMVNPTSCGPLATETTLSSTLGATQSLSSPFAVQNCGALAFKPSFSASTDANASKANGANLQATVTQAGGEANIRSVSAQLPAQLVTRLTTLQQACPEETFAASPSGCPAGSNVGVASVVTPVLAEGLSGTAYLVSHGGAAFPDLDLVLEGSGVRVLLVGNTDITHGVTTSTFASLPDVPISSFSLTLPTGPHSALAANGSLCAAALAMPTTIIAQNGAEVQQNTRIAVAGCSGVRTARSCLRVLRRRSVQRAVMLTVRTCAAGRISASGKYLKKTSRSVRKAATVKLKLPLSRAGSIAVRRHRSLKIRVRLTFTPKQRGRARSSASTSVALPATTR